MNRRVLPVILWSAAIVALLVGGILTTGAVRSAGKTGKQLRGKLDDLGELEILESDLARFLAAERTYTSLARRPDQLNALIQRLMPTQRPSDIRDAGSEELGTWTVLKKDVVFDEVPLGDVMDLVAALERQRPPWRLAKCVIRASAKQEGDGQTVLTLTALERVVSPAP